MYFALLKEKTNLRMKNKFQQCDLELISVKYNTALCHCFKPMEMPKYILPDE